MSLSRKEQWRLNASNYRRKYPEKVRAYKAHKRDVIRTIKTTLREELGNKCIKCGYDDNPRILHFHHLRDKVKDVSQIANYKAIKEEAEKCVLLCPNCHALTHLSHVA